MSVLPIRIFGDPVLRQRAHEVTDFDDALRRLGDDMMETMRHAAGAGLAANQVGVLRRLFTYEWVEERGGEGQSGALVNPEVLETSEEMQDGEEGCLSFPGLFYLTQRPLRARIQAQDVHGETMEIVGEDMLARIFLHEIDHLNGILFIDHLALHDRKEAMRRIREGELEHPVARSPEHADADSALLTAAGEQQRVRVAFFGTPEAAVPALEAFLRDDTMDVAAVVTNPDRPSGRGHRLQPPPVKVAAEAAGAPVWQPERPREILGDLQALGVDACAVVAYGSLLPQDVLDAGGHGFVNLHFSLLPAWRGAAPVQHSLLAGDTRTGVTCFVLEAGMDTGPVLKTAETGVLAVETAGDLITRLAVLGAPVLVEAVRGLVDKSLTPQPQDHDQATYAPKITPEDARLDWTGGAQHISNAVRAFNPIPGAWTTLRGERLKVHRVAPAPESDVGSGGNPGVVTAVAEAGPVIDCGEGALVLTEVQPAGKPRVAGADFVNGYRPQGERLGG